MPLEKSSSLSEERNRNLRWDSLALDPKSHRNSGLLGKKNKKHSSHLRCIWLLPGLWLQYMCIYVLQRTPPKESGSQVKCSWPHAKPLGWSKRKLIHSSCGPLQTELPQAPVDTLFLDYLSGGDDLLFRIWPLRRTSSTSPQERRGRTRRSTYCRAPPPISWMGSAQDAAKSPPSVSTHQQFCVLVAPLSFKPTRGKQGLQKDAALKAPESRWETIPINTFWIKQTKTISLSRSCNSNLLDWHDFSHFKYRRYLLFAIILMKLQPVRQRGINGENSPKLLTRSGF